MRLSHRSLFWKFVRSSVDPENSIWTQFWFNVVMKITHNDLVGKVKSLKKVWLRILRVHPSDLENPKSKPSQAYQW